MPETNVQRVQRKLLVTVVEWGSEREIIGRRTEDSSIEVSPDTETITDILGITYTDVNKTELQQTVDPYYVMADSKLAKYLTKAVLENDVQAYNCKFNVYVIAAYVSGAEEGQIEGGYAVKHKNCTVYPTAIGGSNYVNMPLEIHFSNDVEVGTVSGLNDEFTFSGAGA